MAMSINTNIVSINAQRNLGISGSSLGTTMQRLSSGLRVNSAKDDAAGLAIAERMNAQAKGLVVAARNANDGISLAQTAEGALGKMGDMLQRMRELAVQSSNATNSAADREALQAEVSQLRSEIDRVAKTTTFNGQKILDGSFAGGVFQVGAGAGDNITVGNITNAKADNLGSANYAAATIKMDLTATGAMSDLSAIESGVLKLSIGTGNEPVELGPIAKANSSQERAGQIVSAINAKTADTGVTAFLNQGSDGSISIDLRSSNVEQKTTTDNSVNPPKTTTETVATTVKLEGFTLEKTGFAAAPQLEAANKPTNGGGYEPYRYELQSQVAGLLNAGAASVTVGGLTADDLAGAEALRTATATAIANANSTLFATAPTAAKMTEFGLTGGTLTRSAAGVITSTTAITAPANYQALYAALGGTGTIHDGTNYQSPATDHITAMNAIVAQARNVNLSDLTAGSAAHKFATWVQESPPAGAAAIEAQLAAPKPEDAKFDATTFVLNDLLTDVRAKSGVADATIEDIFGADQTWVDTTTNPAAPAWKTGLTGDEAVAAFKAAEMYVASQKGLGIVEADVKANVSLDELDITTQADAWSALEVIDTAINQVNAARADLGALQTRFEKSIENIDIMNENITGARSRIVDADFAVETAALSRAQILQQAGTAMVAQANQLPQNVLSLLR